MTPDALLDSNVLIAILAEAHEHHLPSLALLNGSRRPRFAIAAHSFAEAYNTLTRVGPRAVFGVPPRTAWAALRGLLEITTLLGLTPAQTVDAIGLYARAGGVGPRLYDKLIGEVAIAHGVTMIVTWNTGHMQGLFPGLTVTTPAKLGHLT